MRATPNDNPDLRPERTRRLGVLWLLSLIVCAGATGLWVRSYSEADTVLWRRGHGVGHDQWQRNEYMARSLYGRLVFWRTGRLLRPGELGNNATSPREVRRRGPALETWSNHISSFPRHWPDPVAGYAGALGFRWNRPVGVETSAKVGIPLWVVVAVTGLLPAVRLRRYLRDQRDAAATRAEAEAETEATGTAVATPDGDRAAAPATGEARRR